MIKCELLRFHTQVVVQWDFEKYVSSFLPIKVISSDIFVFAIFLVQMKLLEFPTNTNPILLSTHEVEEIKLTSKINFKDLDSV